MPDTGVGIIEVAGSCDLHTDKSVCRSYLRSIELLLDLVLELSVVVGEILVCLSSVVGDFDGHEKVVSLVVFHHHLRFEAPPISWMTLFVGYSHLDRTTTIHEPAS